MFIKPIRLKILELRRSEMLTGLPCDIAILRSYVTNFQRQANNIALLGAQTSYQLPRTNGKSATVALVSLSGLETFTSVPAAK